jgi:dimethylsulfone monooxygenase
MQIGLFHPNARSIHAMSPAMLARCADPLDIDAQVAIARAAEEVGLDYLFMADAWGPYGPLSTAMGLQDPILLPPILAAALIPVTSRIELITTVHTSFFSPLVVARMGAALDALSRGRWGINVVTGAGMAEDLLVQSGAGTSHDGRYERAEEFVELLEQAWSGRPVAFHGKHVDLEGRLVGPATVRQPRPLVVSAGASSAGQRFAGRYADMVFMPGRTSLETCRQRMDGIRAEASQAGRRPDAVRLQMHASVVVRSSSAEARAFADELAAGVDVEAVAEYLTGIRSNISTYDDIYAELGELQLRQIGSVAGARQIVGDPCEVADEIEMLHRTFGCDGVAITLPLWQPAEVLRLGELLGPELERRGLWARRTDREARPDRP